MNHSPCTKAYNDTILTFGDFSLETIRAEKERRGHGDSKELLKGLEGFPEATLKEAVLNSFASGEQAKCNKNPNGYMLYGGKRPRRRTMRHRRKMRKTRKH